MKKVTYFCAYVFLLLHTKNATSRGFAMYEQGAVGLSMANARTAIADDVSALYYNPAAIAELDGLQLQFGVNIALPLFSYEAQGRPDVPRTYESHNEEIEINDGLNDVDAKARGFTPMSFFC